MENRWAGTWGILWVTGTLFLGVGLSVLFMSEHFLAGWALITLSALLMLIGIVGVFWPHKRAIVFAVTILGLFVQPSLFVYAQLTDPQHHSVWETILVGVVSYAVLLWVCAPRLKAPTTSDDDMPPLPDKN